MRTLQDLLPALAQLGNHEAVQWTNGFRTIVSSYADVYRTTGSVIAYFQQHGIGKGDRVLIWAENRMEWLAVFWACVASGVVAVPVDFRFSSELVSRIQAESQAKLTVDQAVLEHIAAFRPNSRFPITQVTPDDIVEIVYTSGTTGEPKGVTHRHRHICANLRPFKTEIEKYRKWARPFQPIRILDLLPLSHMFGQALGIYIPVLLGGSVVFTTEIHPGKMIQIVREHRTSVLVAVPQMLENLKHEIERHLTLHSRTDSILLRLWRHRKIHSAFGWKFWAFVAGGAPVDAELEEFWARLGFLVIQGYGLTEASPVVTVNHPFNTKRGSLGKVLPGLEVKIAPDGEILVRGESITTENGAWLYTGDLGAMDAEGRLYYRGRKKDTIVTPEGLNVHPEDVERVLNALPEVRDSVVVSVVRNGHDEVHAALILNVSDVDVRNVVSRANEKLEAHQRIKSWSVWPEHDFPRTPSTMKVRRGEVQRLICGGRLPDAQQIGDGGDISSMSSLERVELLSELESKYQVELNEEEFSQIRDPRELEDWLRRSTSASRMSGAPTPRGRPPSGWARSLPIRALRTAFQKAIAIPLFHHYLPLTVNGLEQLEALKPPVIFAANHTSHLDAPAIVAALPARWRGRLAPAMGLDVFRPYFQPKGFPITQVWWTGVGYCLALGLFNAYPLPQDVAGVRRALNYTGELIKRGYCPLVFPEGMRTPDGKMHPFRPGIGMMAIQLGVPIVPVFIDGLYEVYSIDDKWPRRGPVRVTFGHAQSFAAGTYEEVAESLCQAIQDLGSGVL